MYPKSPESLDEQVLVLKPSTRVRRFIESFRNPGLRSMAKPLFGDVQASGLLSIVTCESETKFRVVADELEALGSQLGHSVPFIPRTGDLDCLSVALTYLRSCCEQANCGKEVLLSTWDTAVRQQLRLLSKTEPAIAGLLRQVTGMGNEDELELQGVEELRLRISRGLDRMHRAHPNLCQQIQNRLQALNTLHN